MNEAQTATTGGAAARPGVRIKVEDMTCGHCASTITKAIQSSIPGATVVAEPGSRLVSVEGADYGEVSRLISAAGYTPSIVGD